MDVELTDSGRMTLSTVRYALLSTLVALGLVLGSAVSGSAATIPPTTATPATAANGATLTFGLGAAPVAAATTPPCENGAPTCVGNDPALTLAWSSAVSTAGCRFQLSLDWGDGAAAQAVTLAGSATRHVWTVPHTYAAGVAARHPYQITTTGTVLSDPQARGCAVPDATLTFTLLCPAAQLSGAAWNAVWPGGDHNIADLNAQFRPRVQAFVAAMTKAGISVTPQSTLRSPQRAYLMHYSYLVANRLLSPQAVPAYTPIAGETGPSVCWLHRTTTGAVDTKHSVLAAARLLSALGVDASLRTPPALRSRHLTGDAIDMALTWTAPTIAIKDATGRTVKITSKPHDDTNPALIAVGASYGVHHFFIVDADRNHWSSDGH